MNMSGFACPMLAAHANLNASTSFSCQELSGIVVAFLNRHQGSSPTTIQAEIPGGAFAGWGFRPHPGKWAYRASPSGPSAVFRLIPDLGTNRVLTSFGRWRLDFGSPALAAGREPPS